MAIHGFTLNICVLFVRGLMKFLVIIVVLYSSVFSYEKINYGKKKILLAYEVNQNKPYYMGFGQKIDWKKPGISLEVLKFLEGRLNIEFEFKRMPWKRATKEIERNRIDGMFHASFRKERLSIATYPMKNGKPDIDKRILTMSYVLYKLKGSKLKWDGKNFHNLEGKIGAVRDYSIAYDLKKRNIKVDEEKNQMMNLLKLSKKRIQGFASLENMSDPIILNNSDKFKNIVKEKTPLKTKHYYLVFSHKFTEENPNLAKDIWNELQKLRENGVYKKISKKYLDIKK